MALISNVRRVLRDLGYKCSRKNIHSVWVLYKFYIGPVSVKRAALLQQKKKTLEKTVGPMMDTLQYKLMPTGFKLYAHQVSGVRFMLGNELGKKTGGILADDMGLGKTLQILAITLANPGHTLIVVPTCVLSQWEEAARHILGPAFEVMVHHGTRRNTDLVFAEEQKQFESIGRFMFVITSHRLMFKGVKGLFIPTQFHKAQWHRLVVDEAHVARNSKSKVFKGIYHIKATYKWMVTGTPVQNRLSDICSLYVLAKVPGARTSMRRKEVLRFRDEFFLRRTTHEIAKM